MHATQLQCACDQYNLFLTENQYWRTASLSGIIIYLQEENDTGKLHLSVLGSGNMGRAMAQCLINAGYTVAIGSRTPGSKHLASWEPDLASAEVVSWEKAIERSEVVFVCLHFDHTMKSLESYREALDGKVLVDVSNLVSSGKSTGEKMSQAEMKEHSQVWSARHLSNMMWSFYRKYTSAVSVLIVFCISEDEDCIG